MSPFWPQHWQINPKVCKELADTPFDGSPLSFKDWYDNIRDHLLGTNQGYGRVLYEIQREPMPLTAERPKYTYSGGLNVNVMWITSALWQCVWRSMVPLPFAAPRAESMSLVKFWVFPPLKVLTALGPILVLMY